MKVKVTAQGVLVPKELLEGVEEVESRKEKNLITIVPIIKREPILELGKHPVVCGRPNASEDHDAYLYGSSS